MLLGGSGAGKTTLLNALIGYEKADATILLNGADVYKNYESVKYKIGFVPQQNLIRGKGGRSGHVPDSGRHDNRYLCADLCMHLERCIQFHPGGLP